MKLAQIDNGDGVRIESVTDLGTRLVENIDVSGFLLAVGSRASLSGRDRAFFGRRSIVGAALFRAGTRPFIGAMLE
jgi:hypothetical protein